MHQSDRGNLPFIVLKLEHFADKEKCIFKSEFFKKKKKKPSILSKMEKAKADDEENKQYEIMMYKNKYIFGLHLHSWHRALGIS